MQRQLLMSLTLIFLTACNNTASIPFVKQPTPTLIFQNSPTSTPVSGIYDQSIHLFEYETGSPVPIKEEHVTQKDGYTIHEISYPSPITGDVPAYLVVPAGNGPFAGMILMHGSSGSRETLLPLAEDFARTGAVVLTLSAPPVRTGRSWISFTPQDKVDQIQLMLDLRRGVDLLSQHDQVDSSRLGYIGYSYGAAMGGLLAGIEPRIKAYGLMVGDGGLVNHFMDGDEPVGGFETIQSETRRRWLEAMEPIEPIQFIGFASPSALFFQNARYDTSVTEEDALAYQAAGSEPKKVEWYDSGHGLPTRAYIDMANWMDEQIGIDAESFQPSK